MAPDLIAINWQSRQLGIRHDDPTLKPYGYDTVGPNELVIPSRTAPRLPG